MSLYRYIIVYSICGPNICNICMGQSRERLKVGTNLFELKFIKKGTSMSAINVLAYTSAAFDHSDPHNRQYQ